MLPFQKLVDNFEAAYDPVANDGALFTFRTNRNALTQPEAWSDIVGEYEKDVRESAFCVNGNQLLLSYLSDVKYVLQIRDLQSGNLFHNLPIDIGSFFWNIKKTLKNDGIVGLYRGFNISSEGIIMYHGIYFGMYGSLKPIVLTGDFQVVFLVGVLQLVLVFHLILQVLYEEE